ncbi:oxygenase MpaB family protein [Nocardioides solisilvae]|uniref:oxygenase MpaB family protein n=1 Tax=Nocardioides solisilvae TaxID=1542435 RepID=UPI000D748E8D|nr:oxygenase MpaB family protein [Nocardioides solisilvae]
MGHQALAERVLRQRELLPDLYAAVHPEHLPERLALTMDDPSDLDDVKGADRAELLADTALVDLMVTATRLGDVVADSYAMRVRDLGMTQVVAMLRAACRRGIDAVPDAPAELRAFLASLEETPDWVDLALVEEGARWERIDAALLTPFVIRGAFLATFLNAYAALPMALTGALTGETSARRVKETASFFAATVLPGGTRRHGPGFEAAAMVRLMHSAVRVHAVRSGRWNHDTHGPPIPQVDQMPAGLINSFLISVAAIRDGRDEFDERERAMIELARYRCFLLGLPPELLPQDPHGVVRVFKARAATLRSAFDDETCGALVRSTLAARLHPDAGRWGRTVERFERSFSTITFVRAFLQGDEARAARMGVRITRADRLRATPMLPLLLGRVLLVRRLSKVRALAPVVDRYVVATLRRRLRGYGHPEYVAREVA